MAADNDLTKQIEREHGQGYEGFVGLMKWGTIISVIVALLVVVLIAS